MTKTMETILGDIYDAWRAQDLEWLASYLPDDFYHVMHIPVAVCAIGGPCEGNLHVLERWRSVVPQFDILRFDTSNLLINKNCARRKSRCNTASNPRARSSIRPKRISGRSRPGGR